MTVHLLPRKNSTWVRTRADGTVLSVRLGAVRHQTSGETMSLDGTLETLTDGRSSNIDVVALLEHFRSAQLLADGDAVRRRRETELLHVSHRLHASLR